MSRTSIAALALVLCLGCNTQKPADPIPSTVSNSAVKPEQPSEPTPSDGPAFAGLSYDDTPSVAVKRLIALGFDEDEKAKQNLDGRFPQDLMYSGTLKEQKALARLIFAPESKLAAVQITFLTADKDCLSFYNGLRDDLTTKFGKPKRTIERYDWPYEVGDGHADTAIKLGKGHLLTLWDREPDDVGLQVSENLTVVMQYEGPQFGKEMERRKVIINKVF